MVSFNKWRITAFAAAVALAFAGCSESEGDELNAGPGTEPEPEAPEVVLPSGSNWALLGDDANTGVTTTLRSALYTIESDGTYTFYFSEDAGLTTDTEMLASPTLLTVSGVAEPTGLQDSAAVEFQSASGTVSSADYAAQSIDINLFYNSKVKLFLELTDDSAEAFRASFDGECLESGFPALGDNAIAVGKEQPVQIGSVVEFRNPAEDVWTYYLYEAEGVTEADPDSALFTLTMPKALVEGAVEYEEGMAPEFEQDFDKGLAEGIELTFEALPTDYAHHAHGTLYAGVVDDPTGVPTRTLAMTYTNDDDDTVIRLAYTGEVTVAYDAANTASRTIGYEDEARESSFEGDTPELYLYSYTDGTTPYIIYSTIKAETLAELNGSEAEGYNYTVLVQLPRNEEGTYTTATPGFAMTAFDYNMEAMTPAAGNDNWFDSYDNDENITSIRPWTDADKAYLSNKTLTLKSDDAEFTYAPSGDKAYIVFNGELTPAYSPTVRPSFRRAEAFAAEAFAPVVELSGEGNPAEVLSPAAGAAGEDESYIQVFDKDGNVISRETLIQAYVFKDFRRYTNQYDVLRTGAGAPFFGMQVFFDSALTDEHSSGAKTPNLMFACDERTGDELNAQISGATVRQFNAVTGEEIILDHDVTFSTNYVQSGYQWISDNDQLFQFAYGKEIVYWGETDTEDSKTSNEKFSKSPVYSPYATASSQNATTPSMAYGTTTKGSMKISHDEETDVWSVDITVLDRVPRFSAWSNPQWTEEGTGITVEIHWRGAFTK